MNIADILGEDGLLKKAILGFTPREPQQKMAQAIMGALEVNSHLIIEAGTGTGKTFGYLIPVFLAQKKTIISTGTKNLQDQLFFNDIPTIKNILSYAGKIALLKGRSNYLCKHRLEKNIHDGRFASRELVSQLHDIHSWAAATESGDISDLHQVPEDSAIWPYVTSTPDNCLGQDCAFYKECFVVKARQQALSADIVVVNHHLFFSDLALQEEGFDELLPGADVVIFDEAHHLPEIASHFFSTSLTGRQLLELARDIELVVAETANDLSDITEECTQLQKVVHQMRLSLGHEQRRASWPENLSSDLKQSIQLIKDSLQLLEEKLKIASVRSKELESCWRRSGHLIEKFNLLTSTAPNDAIHWFETFLQSFTLQLTPMVVADQFKKYIQEERKRSWIFTSATLTVKNNFQLFIDTLGLQQALQLQLKSPFDYQKQALFYAPRGLPDSHAQDYANAMINAVIPILELTQGKTFLLFTSHKAMENAWHLLKERVSFPLLLQGTLPKKELVEQFKTLGNAVLLGTSSFWYGVDVRGDALSCVIIDKLPFAAPDDPILQARINLLRKQGVDPFQTYQLPHAVLTLKQGAGRLIRDVRDRGILMICDPRIVGSRYAHAFLQSLPDMPRTRELSKVQQFLAKADSGNNTVEA